MIMFSARSAPLKLKVLLQYKVLGQIRTSKYKVMVKFKEMDMA